MNSLKIKKHFDLGDTFLCVKERTVTYITNCSSNEIPEDSEKFERCRCISNSFPFVAPLSVSTKILSQINEGEKAVINAKKGKVSPTVKNLKKFYTSLIKDCGLSAKRKELLAEIDSFEKEPAKAFEKVQTLAEQCGAVIVPFYFTVSNGFGLQYIAGTNFTLSTTGFFSATKAEITKGYGEFNADTYAKAKALLSKMPEYYTNFINPTIVVETYDLDGNCLTDFDDADNYYLASDFAKEFVDKYFDKGLIHCGVYDYPDEAIHSGNVTMFTIEHWDELERAGI